MKRKMVGVVLGGAVALLSACGSSSPVDGTGTAGAVGVPSKDVALASKEDALRELAVASALAAQVAGGKVGLNSGSEYAKRVRALAFASEERNETGVAGTQSGTGSGGGTYKTVGGAASHSFALFDGRSESAASVQRTDNAFRSTWSHADGTTESLTLNGVSQTGNVAGADLSFERQGEGSSFYTETYEKRRGGSVIDASTVQFLGVAEALTPDTGPLDARAILSYRYSAHGGDFFSADVGETGSPFRVVQGDTLTVDGRYGYAQKGAAGGQALVTTVRPLALDGSGSHASDGVLKFESGSRTATFTFKPDGSAELQLNGSTVTVPAGEIRAALLGRSG